MLFTCYHLLLPRVVSRNKKTRTASPERSKSGSLCHQDTRRASYATWLTRRIAARPQQVFWLPGRRRLPMCFVLAHSGWFASALPARGSMGSQRRVRHGISPCSEMLRHKLFTITVRDTSRLTLPEALRYHCDVVEGIFSRTSGNPVRVRGCPATVTADEDCS